MNAEQRQKVEGFERVLNQIKLTNPTAPLQHVIAFLHVSLNPGIAVNELGRATGVPNASVSRHVKALAGHGTGAHQPALVIRGMGRDERTKAILLTGEGQRLLDQLLEAASTGAVHQAASAVTPEEAQRTPPRKLEWRPFG